MKRGICVLLAVGLIGASAVATASTHPLKPLLIPTTITHDGTVQLSNGQSVISGHLSSRRGVCRVFREVLVKAHYSDGTVRVLDGDLTSDHGAWAVKGDISRVDRLRAKVRKQTLGGAGTVTVLKHHQRPPDSPRHERPRIACGADSVVWTPPNAGLLAVPPATASRARPTRHFSTTISHDGDIPLAGDRFLATGHITPRGGLCSDFFRVVKVTAHLPNGTTRLLDEDFTSFAGAWAVKADINGAQRLKAKSKAVRVPGGRGYRTRILCEAASVVWGLD